MSDWREIRVAEVEPGQTIRFSAPAVPPPPRIIESVVTEVQPMGEALWLRTESGYVATRRRGDVIEAR